MRELVLMRGLPGSGKSTMISELNLEPYTLSTDDLRIKLSSLEQTADGFCISQRVNKDAFNILYSLLEKRMKNGEFTIIDATHINIKSCSEYKKLADKCSYNIYYYEMGTSLDECLLRNSNRAGYKYVPEDVIVRMHSSYSKDLGDGIVKIDNLSNFIREHTVHSLKRYRSCIIIGDIHSCASPLRSLLKDFKDDFKYIFLGDYFDRGIEHYETFKILKNLSKEPNVVMLLGNHERHILNYCNGDAITSSSANETFRELEKHGVTKEELREFYNNLKEYYSFNIFNKKYFCCHGGLSFIPDRLRLTSLHTLTTGVGTYETEIDEIYERNFKDGLCDNFIQIHGHRRTVSSNYSYCLEGGVEFGGDLMVLGIRPNKLYINRFSNKLYKDGSGYVLDNDTVSKIVNTSGVNVKELKDNIISVNFSRAVFESKIWNSSTVKARGLFVDRDTGKVVARSYDKFFNIGEVEETSLNSLSKNLVYPVKIIEKANGFLGIVSILDGKLKFFSKTTDSSVHVDMLKDCWNALMTSTKNKLVSVLARNNCSVVFEVIHKNDPHIVEYKSNCLYLLDFIENNVNTNILDIDFKVKDSNLIIPKTMAVVNSYSELLQALSSLDKLKQEGAVCTDASGFKFKFKTLWYNKWKLRRKIIDSYKIGRRIRDNKRNTVFDADTAFYEFIDSRNDVLCKTLFDIREIADSLGI